MIICTECGTHNEAGESFCGQCGAYLDFASQPADPETVAASDPDPVGASGPSAAPGPSPQPVMQAVPAADPSPARANPQQQQPNLQPSTQPAPGAEWAGADPAWLAGPSPEVPEAAASGRIVRAEPGPAQAAIPTAEQPVVTRQPQRVARKAAPPRRVLPPEDRRPQPGELICGGCGAGNAPERRFCRRCGTSLADAPVVKLHWWQRVIKPKQGKQAGYRRRVRTRRGLHLTGPVIAAIIVVVLVGAGWWFSTTSGYQWGLDHIEGTRVVTPVCADAAGSRSAAGHGPKLLTDGATNQVWEPDGGRLRGVSGAATCTFASSQRLVTLRVYTGQSANDPKAFHQRERVITLKVVVLNGSGHAVTTKTLSLSDNPGPQSFDIRASGVRRVELEAVGVTHTKSALPAALGEVQFLVRK